LCPHVYLPLRTTLEFCCVIFLIDYRFIVSSGRSSCFRSEFSQSAEKQSQVVSRYRQQYTR
jgi:hypothetical protein